MFKQIFLTRNCYVVFRIDWMIALTMWKIAMHLSYFWYHWWIRVQTYPIMMNVTWVIYIVLVVTWCQTTISSTLDYFESLLLLWEDNWIEIHFPKLNWWNIVGAIISIFQVDNVCQFPCNLHMNIMLAFTFGAPWWATNFFPIDYLNGWIGHDHDYGQHRRCNMFLKHEFCE